MKPRLSGTLWQVQKAVRRPDKALRFAVRKMKEALLWEHYYSALREPKARSPVPHDPLIHDEITEELEESGFRVVNLSVDVADYKRYIKDAEYNLFPAYYGGGRACEFSEKSLEHYLAAKLLDLREDDTYIDIASADSPTTEIYRKLYGCRAFRQDLAFPHGIHGDTIGGDASNMPVEDGFATKMALHCSFEHFEQDSDTRFVREAGRVLRKGGKLCIVPLYLFDRYAIQTNPCALPRGGIPFESDAVLYCARGTPERHCRFYDVPHLVTRIAGCLSDLELTIYAVQNQKEVDPSCYVKFIALLEKP